MWFVEQGGAGINPEPLNPEPLNRETETQNTRSAHAFITA